MFVKYYDTKKEQLALKNALKHLKIRSRSIWRAFNSYLKPNIVNWIQFFFEPT